MDLLFLPFDTTLYSFNILTQNTQIEYAGVSEELGINKCLVCQLVVITFYAY